MTHTKRKTIIGITGGIATGKSTLANILKELGYKVTLTTKSRMADIEKNLFVLKRYNRGKDFRMDKLL